MMLVVAFAGSFAGSAAMVLALRWLDRRKHLALQAACLGVRMGRFESERSVRARCKDAMFGFGQPAARPAGINKDAN